MTEALENRIQRLLHFYLVQMILTRQGTVDKLCELALDPAFFQHLSALPEELVLGLREIGEQGCAHPEDLFSIGGYDGGPGDYPDFLRQQNLRSYWCIRRLREHFYPELPQPTFEPVKQIGMVRECLCRDGVALVLGEFDWFYIRKNPVYCVTPEPRTVPITVTGVESVKHNHEDSSDPDVRRFGWSALVLADDISPDSVPSGSTVWVDRTAVAEIPPL